MRPYPLPRQLKRAFICENVVPADRLKSDPTSDDYSQPIFNNQSANNSLSLSFLRSLDDSGFCRVSHFFDTVFCVKF